MIRNFNSSFISAKDKRASKSGAYGLHKHLLERMRGNFKSVVHEQAAAGFSIDIRANEDTILARTGDATGTIAFGKYTDNLYVYDGSHWQIYFND